MIGQTVHRAKAGLVDALFLSSDPCCDGWACEHRDNARRLRSNLLELNRQIVEEICEEIGTVIQTARLAHMRCLTHCPARAPRRKPLRNRSGIMPD